MEGRSAALESYRLFLQLMNSAGGFSWGPWKLVMYKTDRRMRGGMNKDPVIFIGN